MKGQRRHTKVGDLLHNPWLVDTIDFSERYVDSMPNILAPGVSGTITMQALNNYSVQVFVTNIVCTVEDISDISGEPFTRDISVDEYEVLFTLPEDNVDMDEVYSSFNDIYYISAKDFSIDLEDCMANAIKSQDPIVKKKDDESLSDWWIDEYEMYSL